jgi:hypothetical protein
MSKAVMAATSAGVTPVMSILARVGKATEQADEKEQWRGGRRRRHAGDVEHDGAAGLPGIGGALVADPVGQDGNAAVQNADLVACDPKDRRLPLGRTGGPPWCSGADPATFSRG